jgi:hypothetical protein
MRAGVERDALVVGMTLVPGFVSRNRSFGLFEDPEVQRARTRSSVLRGIVKQLAGSLGHVEDLAVARSVDRCELRYRVPALRIDRRASLSGVELACVRYLAGRAGVPGLHASPTDREEIEAALERLAAGLHLAQIDTER